MDNLFLDKANGTVVNQTCHSLNERKLEITSIVPLSELFTNIFFFVHNKYKKFKLLICNCC